MAPRVFHLLFEPRGIPGGVTATEIAPADRSNLTKEAFRFKTVGATYVLHTRRRETPDAWGEQPIRFFPELICVHLNLVLIRIHSTDSRRFPTEFWVFKLDTQSPTVVMLPKVAREIWASQSFGLVYKDNKHCCGDYVVANLQRKYNQDTEKFEVFLHRWFRSGLSWKSSLNYKVTLPKGLDTYIEKWQCDQVITFGDALLWVDLSQELILRCKKPSEICAADFDFIRLPHMGRVSRPQTIRSVDCCRDDLKFVSVDATSGVNTPCVTIMTFNETSYRRCKDKIYSRSYWDLSIRQDLWAAKNMAALRLSSGLEAYHMPCFPVLSTYKGNVLQLIMAGKDNKDALILQVNTRTWTFEDVADYPRFSNHQKRLYCSNFLIG